jgi:hypothetical protein
MHDRRRADKAPSRSFPRKRLRVWVGKGQWGRSEGGGELTPPTGPPISERAAVRTRSAFLPRFSRVPCLAP